MFPLSPAKQSLELFLCTGINFPPELDFSCQNSHQIHPSTAQTRYGVAYTYGSLVDQKKGGPLPHALRRYGQGQRRRRHREEAAIPSQETAPSATATNHGPRQMTQLHTLAS